MRTMTVPALAAGIVLGSAALALAAPPAHVEQAQRELQASGLYDGPIDGIAGTKTHQALRDYQRRQGLSVTGRLDDQTMRMLTGQNTSAGSSGMGTSTGADQAPAPSAPVNASGHPNNDLTVPGHRNANEYSGNAKR